MLQIQALRKSYAVPVLSDINLALRPGEIHALVGENGAGKSTLVRIIAGLTQPDAGQMTLRGKVHAPASRRQAEQAGIQLVLQELNLINTLSVAENIHLAALPRRLGFIDYRRLHAQSRTDLARVGLEAIDPGTPVGKLGVGEQQLVEIAAALARPAKVLMLDEPTAALTDPQIDLLFQRLVELKRQGVVLLYISHRLEEIQRIADRITVLRDGCLVASEPAASLSLDRMIALMAGRPLTEQPQRGKEPTGKVVLEVKALCRGDRVRQVSFELRQGEILGLAGLIGSGRTETLRALFGADPAESGLVRVAPGRTPAVIRRPADAMSLGIGMIPEDRKQQGLLLPQPSRVNITLANLGLVSHGRTWIDRTGERRLAAQLAARLDVRGASLEQPVRELSGGNQQKVILARWLLRDCQVLLFDEPTRGIDVGTKWMIYQLLADLARQGKAMLVASSDLLELMTVCDRIGVMSNGRLVRIFDRGAWSQEAIMAAAFSGYLRPGGSERGTASPPPWPTPPPPPQDGSPHLANPYE